VIQKSVGNEGCDRDLDGVVLDDKDNPPFRHLFFLRLQVETTVARASVVHVL
jgi:hypothetical protein